MDAQTQLQWSLDQAELWRRGFKAFHDCIPFGDMHTEAERDGWETARRELLRLGEQIVRRGR